MRCLSFGYWIVLIILFNAMFAISSTPSTIRSVVTTGLFIWFIVGFFIECEI